MSSLTTEHEGRRLRLARVIELLEACAEMGEALDPEIARTVLEDAEQQILHEQDRVALSLPKGAKLPEAQPQDFRDAAALITASRIVYDVVTCLLMRKPPGRRLRKALEIRDEILEEIVRPLLLGMNPEDAATIMANAATWKYTLWNPEHEALMTSMLAAVAKGGCIRKETKEAAGYFLAMMVPATERDKGGSDQGEQTG